jgi:hypothetical protein
MEKMTRQNKDLRSVLAMIKPTESGKGLWNDNSPKPPKEALMMREMESPQKDLGEEARSRGGKTRGR